MLWNCNYLHAIKCVFVYEYVCSKCSGCQKKSACEMQISIWGHSTYFIFVRVCVCSLISLVVFSLWSLEQNLRAGGVHTWADSQSHALIIYKCTFLKTHILTYVRTVYIVHSIAKVCWYLCVFIYKYTYATTTTRVVSGKLFCFTRIIFRQNKFSHNRASA